MFTRRTTQENRRLLTWEVSDGHMKWQLLIQNSTLLSQTLNLFGTLKVSNFNFNNACFSVMSSYFSIKQKRSFLLKVALQINRAKRCYNSNTVSNKYISATCTAAAAQKTPLYLQFVRL